jgi:hypothetical protein
MAWVQRPGRSKGPMRFPARQVIVTPDNMVIERDTILRMCTARGVGLERTRRTGTVEKLTLARLAELVGIEGEHFRSRKEASRWIELRQLQAGGVVRALRRNPRFLLHTVSPEGLKVAISEYTGDFAYDEAAPLVEQWTLIIEECKGFPMPDWLLRKKWVEAEYGITLRVT